LGDNARGVLRLMPASAADTKSYADISPEELDRGDILRLVHAKNSYGPKAPPIWLRRLNDGLLEQITCTMLEPSAPFRRRIKSLVASKTSRLPYVSPIPGFFSGCRR
jgi:hypothetical protein